MRELLRRWAPPLAWMGVIYVLSAQPSLPSAPEPWLDVVLKKSGHALAYGLLAWLYLRALRGKAPHPNGCGSSAWSWRWPTAQRTRFTRRSCQGARLG